jgi:hypothetical protein
MVWDGGMEGKLSIRVLTYLDNPETGVSSIAYEGPGMSNREAALDGSVQNWK